MIDTQFLATKQIEPIAKLIEYHENSVPSQIDEAICRCSSIHSSLLLSNSNNYEQSPINVQLDSSSVQSGSNNSESIKTYDNPYDELLDYAKPLISYGIKDFHLEPKHEAPKIHEINNIAYQSVVSKYKDELAQIVCIHVYNDDFHNSEMYYDNWINEKIIDFFINHRERNQYKYEMKIDSAVDKIIKDKNVEKNFLKLLLHSIVVSLYLCIKKQKYKTTDQYYPDDRDYHCYSYMFDVIDLTNLRKNLESELDVLGNLSVLEQFEF